jgi:hypothetical protein
MLVWYINQDPCMPQRRIGYPAAIDERIEEVGGLTCIQEVVAHERSRCHARTELGYPV